MAIRSSIAPSGARSFVPRALQATSLALLFTLPVPSHAATPRVHALVNARIVTAPGQVIEKGTIVMRDGVIVSAGPKTSIPADARIWEADSLTVYAGLIDACVIPTAEERSTAPAEAGGRRPGAAAARARGAAHVLGSVHPELRMSEMPPLTQKQVEGLRAAGFAVAQVVPREGILRGQSAVVGLDSDAPNQAVLKADAAQVISIESQRSGYPGSLMGAIAVIRQAFLDARWYRDVQAAYARSPRGRERPETNVSWEALQPVVAGRQPVLFVTDEMLEVLRSASIAREATLTAMVVGAGDEYKRAPEIAASGMSVVVPVNFPEAPDVADAEMAHDVSTEELRHWYYAPENAKTLASHSIPFALTANGLKETKTFRAQVAKAIERGLKPVDALAAVTTTPARMLGLSDRLGTNAPGKIATHTVTRGDLFSEKGRVVAVWVDGESHPVDGEDESFKGSWSLQWDGQRGVLLVAADKDTTVKLVRGADTLSASQVRLDPRRLRFTIGSDQRFDQRIEQGIARGSRVAGATTDRVLGVKLPEDPSEKTAKKSDEKSDAKDRETVAAAEKGGGKGKKDEPPIATPAVMGNTEAWRARAPVRPAAVLVRNATVWTAGPQGTLEGADLLIRDGKVVSVGRGLKAPAGAQIIDGTGKHIAPGIIDEHSHSAILGNVNECTNNLTAEVRIGDVVNSESIQIYRQLAGGTTIMHLLHGSCNAIGGQSAVIKNKWGESPDRLVFGDAPPTIKFALGENPKQSNWGNDATDRYPKSRAGVEQSIREAFERARDYRAAQAEARAGKRPYPPKPDLQAEAIAEILEGERMIHCHSYRQDEILMLMRLAESFGTRVNTFTHILEGYKVADEMAAHGASAMGFTDWWAYKFEVIDAIPHNGYLTWDRGVNTGFNSDDSELARRLNTEAAKAVKYGGVPPEEAIKFVTLNPAKSLKIDQRVGSLEPGKDADFSIWSGSPLSQASTCEQTWIEGRKYFDRGQDLSARNLLAVERDALLARAKDGKKEGGGGGRGNWPPRYLEDTDMSGNSCGADSHPFLSEAERRARQNGGTER